MAAGIESEASPKIQEAQKHSKSDPVKSESIYKEILSRKPAEKSAALQEYEAALIGLGETYKTQQKWNDLAELVKSSTSSLTSFPKAKTAKLGMFSSCTDVP